MTAPQIKVQPASASSLGAFGWARLIAGLLGVALATASLPGFLTSPADAAGEVGDGSDWGPIGSLQSDSAVTVRWDNLGNPPSGLVYRDGRQVLPHSGGATYDDVDPDTLTAYNEYFGSDNDFGGLQVEVSQTEDLVNQTVTLDVSGVRGGAPYGTYSPVYLQVFQCWGGLTADGKPAPEAANPDPATCQVGAGDAIARASAFAIANSRYLKSDPLVPNGDWAPFFNKIEADSDVPFTAVTGKRSGSTNNLENEFFNTTTTNEISKIQVSASGTATRQFELQTSVESPGLGCGRRSGVVSTPDCWLVVIPRIDGVLSQNGPISPSLWAQRLQVRLGFRDIVAGCPGGQIRTLVAGSEMLASAASSWTPGLCKAKSIALGYTQLGDQVARAQFDNGANPAVLTSQPVAGDAVYVPVGLAAPVIAYSLSYQPFCPAREEAYTEQEAAACGYSSLDDLEADLARSGALVRDLRLDARLVAKLLTQSYALSIFDQEGFRRDGWMVQRPASLATDPEFLRLNPSLAHISLTASSINALDHLIVEGLRSDAASAVWDWILADADARAFLNGCPDPDGMVVNPFYSTRTYVGCEADAAELAATAARNREATPKPLSYVDLALTYPPDGSPYPLPGWQEAAPEGAPPYTVVDYLPRIESMPVAGRDVATGYLPRNSELCLTVLDASCQPAPGKWRDPKTRQRGDKLGVMAITDSATAARFQLPTALLCDSAGAACVGADTASLHKAAARFVDPDDDGVLEPAAPDYASGAYPLALPVYAAVSSKLPAADQHNYGDVLQYVVTTGQHPGFSPGDLPPGHAPLVGRLLADAKAGIAELRGAQDPTPTPSPTPKPSKDPNPGGGPDPADPDPEPSPSPSDGVTIPTSAAPEFVTVAAGTESWPRLTLPLGLGIAFLAAAAGPLMRMRSRFRVGRR